MWMLVKLSWRSLWRNRRRTLITICSIALGMTCALFFIALADGMYKKLINQAVRMEAGHVAVEHPEYRDAPAIDRFTYSVAAVRDAAAKIRGVERVKPLILGQAVVSTGSGSAGVGLTAVDPEAEQATSVLAHKIVDGRYIAADDRRGVVLGKSLAERLKLEPGKKLVVTTNDVHGELVNELLRVTGVFETGMDEVDSFMIQVPLGVGRRIFHLETDQATRVGLILENPDDQQRVQQELVAALQGKPVAVLPWQEVLPDLASYIAVDGGSNYVFQGIIMFLIGFTILNTILMSVLERKREFATLLAIGTSPLLLRLQILVESAFLGLFGCVAGLAVGGGLAHHLEVNGLDMSELFKDGASVAGFTIDPLVRADLTVGLMTWLGIAVFLGTMIIGLYPAFKSSRVEIADVLRTH